MYIKSSGKTDIGLVRKLNEDSIKLNSPKKLFIVCDGMGGHNAGEVASSTACEMVNILYGNFFDRLRDDESLRLSRMFPPSTDVLIKSVRIANHWIHRQAATNPSLSGMGTTIVAVAIEEDIITVLHVGDSRIYRLYDNKLTPLTIDHSWAAELEQSEKMTSEEVKKTVNRNVITRALGVKDVVEIDVAVRKIVENEAYILVSDGLCGYVEDIDIEEAIRECQGDTEKITLQLVALANDRGGPDNVSILALKIIGKVEPSQLPELLTVTVEAEAPEYFEDEEKWAMSAENRLEDSETTIVETSKNLIPILAMIIIIILMAAIFYFILKN